MKAFNQHNQSSADLYKFKEETGIEKLIGAVAFVGFVVAVVLL
jgi:hypothetical protein